MRGGPILGVGVAAASLIACVGLGSLAGGDKMEDAGEAPPDGGDARAPNEAGGGGPDANEGRGQPDARADVALPFTCPNTGRGSPMVSVGSFCVDRTEATNADYRQFLASNPRNEHAACTQNTSFVPQTGPPPNDQLPVGHVDWCDAYAFCKWAGKRMCGAISGGETPVSQWADPNVSQWHFACTKGGAQTFAYGNTFMSVCNVGSGSAVVVASLPGCVGGFSDLFDMSGNVWEWEDSCSGDTCYSRGAAYTSSISEAACAVRDQTPRLDNTNGNTGIRCCAP